MYRNILCCYFYSQNVAVAFENISGYLSQMVPFIKPVSVACCFAIFQSNINILDQGRMNLHPTVFRYPLLLHLHPTGTYFSVKDLCTCFAIDRDMFRKILISCEVLANSSPSRAFSNK